MTDLESIEKQLQEQSKSLHKEKEELEKLERWTHSQDHQYRIIERALLEVDSKLEGIALAKKYYYDKRLIEIPSVITESKKLARQELIREVSCFIHEDAERGIVWMTSEYWQSVEKRGEKP